MSQVRAIAMSLLLVVAGVSFAFALVGTASAQTEQVTLTVTVVDRNDQPLGGIDLTASWEGGSTSETTASNGKAFVDVPAGANVSIRIDDDQYVRNLPYELTNATEQDVTVDVARQGVASVTVRSEGQPIQGATVRLFRDGRTIVDARSDENGRVTTEPIERGEYTVRAVKPGYYRNDTHVTVGERTERTVTLERGSVVVTFNVTDDHFSPSRPIESATISIDDVGTFSVASDGKRTISVPVNTRLSVTVTKEGYGTVERSPYVRESERTLDVAIRRTPTLTVEALSDRVIVGESTRVVVTDEYGDPVENATVSIGDETIGRTNDRGGVVMPIESAGNVTVTASTTNLSAEVTITGVEAGTATPEPTPTQSPTPTTQAEGPGFSLLLALVGLLAYGVASGRSGR